MLVTRAELIEGISGDAPVDEACRKALAAGAAFRVHEERARLSDLVSIYDRRVRHLTSKGIATIGADTLLGRLAAVEADSVRLGLVFADDFNFTLFLDVDRPIVLASIGVDRAI